MQQPVVIIGIGELGGVFAKAFLKKGHRGMPDNKEDGYRRCRRAHTG